MGSSHFEGSGKLISSSFRALTVSLGSLPQILDIGKFTFVAPAITIFEILFEILLSAE